ncbi:5-bromo-4-chloroindolyl phosphate hydrolysis family protein [Lactococcus kimchii]|uniref:5-bromo-4-chloroindolyl phosphate hydrolysis family protein n=1 Tax=Lactococcus sp. S-13 TaxID=2507158 RepID=UPI001022BD4C|nr:5-bromo-4-chloroindolyl phosphate hydrolysis family protein [Lactococcus sp. S-13]RZI48110.1 5-bromo-4-chloroindolyl phosphate hydrolase [Lactococcus sp. S-13]
MPVSLFVHNQGMMSGDGHWGMVNMIFGLILFFLVIKMIIGIAFMRKNRQDKMGGYEDKAMSLKENIERYHEAGLSDSDIKIFRENLAEAKTSIKTWEAQTKKDDDLQVVESVTGGLDASKHTFKYIVQNPQELTKQNEFLYKDLPNMVKLTEKFIEMKKQAVRTEEIKRDLDETLLLIKTLSASISKNYHEILMDDVKVIKNQVKFD